MKKILPTEKKIIYSRQQREIKFEQKNYLPTEKKFPTEKIYSQQNEKLSSNREKISNRKNLFPTE